MIDLAEYRKYVDRIDTMLRACSLTVEITDYSFAVGAGLISLRFQMIFIDGSKLIVSEFFAIPSSQMKGPAPTKKITYQYMQADGKPIFRLDHHGISSPLDTSLHLDLPDQKHIEEGDPRLRGTGIAKANFFDVYGWVSKYLTNKPLPWEEEKDAKT